MTWLGVKGLAATLLLEKDALHIYAAFAIQIGVAAARRRSLGDWWPWLAVLGFELVNESLDMYLGEEASIKPWQIYGAIHDLINTMTLPSALMFLSRYRPGMFVWRETPPRPVAPEKIVEDLLVGE